jgi:hypothetical protein
MRIPGRKSTDSNGDWVSQVSSTIIDVIDSIHDAAVVPLTTIARAIVFGTLALILGTGSLVLLTLGLTRLLDVYLDNIPGFPEGVWVAYLVMGAIFVGASLFLWSKRRAKEA